MSFDSLGLCEPLLRAISEQGYTEPSPIQAQAIPAVLSGRDVMAAAQTGTGKTAGFTLPLLEMLRSGPKVKAKHARTLVLTPTRELAAQVGANVAEYGKHLPMRSTVVFGGVGINPQISKLRHGVDVLIATPGRLLDLHGQGAVSFKELEVLVLDEADRMLDMGFIHDIKRILKLLPQKRQTLMFSATFSNEIKKLANGLVNDPVLVEVSPPNSTVDKVTQWICPVDKSKKPAALAHMIHEQNWQQVLIFSRTKHGANRLARFLESKGIQAAAIHGNKSQNARTQALAGFKSGKIRALVATDIAARGLDIDQLPQVVNVDLPNVPEDYVHRIGRTGRAGASGQAVSLVSADEAKLLFAIERLIGKTVPREYHDEFYPEHELPASPAPGKRPSGGGGGGGRNGGQNKPRKPQGGGGKGGQNRGRGQAGGNSGSGNADPDKKPARRRRRRRPSSGGGGGGTGGNSGGQQSR